MSPLQRDPDILTNPKKVIHMGLLTTLFFHTPILYFVIMDKLSFDVSKISEDRLCVEISVSGASLGLVYYERAKRGYTNKPVSMDRWVCVDASVQDLYIHGSMEIECITPKMIMEECQKVISSL